MNTDPIAHQYRPWLVGKNTRLAKTISVTLPFGPGECAIVYFGLERADESLKIRARPRPFGDRSHVADAMAFERLGCAWWPMCRFRLFNLRHYLYDNAEANSIAALFCGASDVGLRYTPD